MAAIQMFSQQRFDRDNRLRPLVLALVILAHLVAALLILRLFSDVGEAETRETPLAVLEGIVLPPPLEEPDPPGSPVFEEAPPGLAGGSSRAGLASGGPDTRAERARRQLPDPALRLTRLDVSAGGDGPDIDLDRLGDIAGIVPGVGAGTGSGRGTGHGSGLGNDGTGAGGVDTTRNVSWSPRFDRRVIQRLMPRAARRQRIYGLVVLECTALRDDRVADCVVIEEHPQGLGFGEAALAAQPHLLLQVTDASGSRIYGERIRPYIEFRVR